MFNNKFLDLIQDNKIKESLQFDLYKGKNIYYSNNGRGIPDAIYSNNDNHFVVNPDQYQIAFTTTKLKTIEECIKDMYSNDDIKQLKELWINNNEEFIEVIKEDSQQQNQYNYEDILEYFVLLFNIEDEIQETNFKNEDNKNIAIKTILTLSIKGYKVETNISNNLNFYKIIIKDNNNISGEIGIILDKVYYQYKDIELINIDKRELMKNDLSIALGTITNKIDGFLPFNN